MSETDYPQTNQLTSNSADFYLYENRIRTNIIYKVAVLALFLAIGALPFIYVDITVSATSSVRPLSEKSTINAAVAEYVDSVYVKEGDSLTQMSLRRWQHETRYI